MCCLDSPIVYVVWAQTQFNAASDQWEKHDEAAVSYADHKTSIERYYEENVDHREQTDKLVQETMNSLEKNSIERADLLKALNEVTNVLKVVQEAVKDDHVLNRKVDTENTGSDVDGKENVGTDGDGIENVGDGIGEVISFDLYQQLLKYLQQHLTKCTSSPNSCILFSSLPGVLTPVRGESLKILMDLISLYQIAINSRVVSPLATSKVHIHGRLRTISTLRT
ncbi:hypothetical protein Tco_1213173 [Tanacetum coccineum]